MCAGNISKVSTQLRMAIGKEKDSIFLGVMYDPTEFILILFLATVIYLVISSVRQFYRLRHFQGPAWAAWTKLWLLRTVTSGRMHHVFYTTTKKYGM